MVPHMPDEWDGHAFAKADARPSVDAWEYQTLISLTAPRREGLPFSFVVPFHEVTYDAG